MAGLISDHAADAHAAAPAATATTARAPRAFHSAAAWARLTLVLALGLATDLTSKAWSFHSVADQPVRLDRRVLLENPGWNVPHHDGVHALPFGLLDFQLVINHGAVFGIGENRRFFFIAFTLGALLAGMFVFGRFTRANQWLAHVAIGLILAGGIGNLYDRIVFGVVRDFLHMLPDWNLPFHLTWPGGSPEMLPWVFNLADVMLLTGMGLLIEHMHRLERRARPAASTAAPAPGV
jgi:signal peptidase II